MNLFRKNILFNYLGQTFLIILNLIFLPIFMSHFSSEEFGFIMFFFSFQIWIGYLDFGLSPTFGRQLAYSINKENETANIQNLYFALSIFFLFMSAIVFSIVHINRQMIVAEWLDVNIVNITLFTEITSIIGFIVALRLFSSFLRSGINGIEDQVWLNKFLVLVNTYRYAGVYTACVVIDSGLMVFFFLQASAAIIEVGVMLIRLNKSLSISLKNHIRMNRMLQQIYRIFPFAGGIAYSSLIWLLISQMDKILLSSKLSLSEFGYFGLVTVITGGVLAMIGPVTNAALPRLTAGVAKDDGETLIANYRKATQYILWVVAPVVCGFAFASEKFILIWTGNQDAATWCGEVAWLFIIGSGLLAISSLLYTLQMAFGDLKLHVLGSTVSLVIQAPIMYYCTINWGVLGAGGLG